MAEGDRCRPGGLVTSRRLSRQNLTQDIKSQRQSRHSLRPAEAFGWCRSANQWRLMTVGNRGPLWIASEALKCYQRRPVMNSIKPPCSVGVLKSVQIRVFRTLRQGTGKGQYKDTTTRPSLGRSALRESECRGQCLSGFAGFRSEPSSQRTNFIRFSNKDLDRNGGLLFTSTHLSVSPTPR